MAKSATPPPENPQNHAETNTRNKNLAAKIRGVLKFKSKSEVATMNGKVAPKNDGAVAAGVRGNFFKKFNIFLSEITHHANLFCTLYSQYAYAGVHMLTSHFFLQQLHNTHTSDL